MNTRKKKGLVCLVESAENQDDSGQIIDKVVLEWFAEEL